MATQSNASSYSALPTKKVTAANGIEYTYRDAGSGKLPVILFQHFRGNLDNWDPALIDALSAQRRVITFNYTGVGSSSGSTPSTIYEMSRDALAFTEALGLECVGVQAIAAFFAATSGGMYETIEFTHETTTGRKTYLEWQGKAFGKHVGGTTILTRNHEGLIEHIIAPCQWSWSLPVNWQSVWRRKVDQALFPVER
jgi:hypothetical protein